MKIKEFMKVRVVTVEPNTPIKMAALIMGQAAVDVLLVAENRIVLGTVSERNLVSGSMLGTRRRFGCNVFQVMSKEILWLYEDDDLQSANLMMESKKAQAALIKDSQEQLVGTLSAIKAYRLWPQDATAASSAIE